MKIRDLIENGTITMDTEVLGEFPRTKDGVIAMAPAVVFDLFGNEMRINRHVTSPGMPILIVSDGQMYLQEYRPVGIDECYATRSAAEKARAAK